MKVNPKNESMRKMLKHPNGTSFRAEGPAEWPDDSFTARRIRDGDVTVVKEVQPQPEPLATEEKSEKPTRR